MKITRHKNIFGLIYMALLAVPFVSILARVIYVQSNKNAFESYSGEVETTFEYEGVAQIQNPPKFTPSIVDPYGNVKNSYYIASFVYNTTASTSSFDTIPTGLEVLSVFGGKNEYSPLIGIKKMSTNGLILRTNNGDNAVSTMSSQKTQLMFHFTDIEHFANSTFTFDNVNYTLVFNYSNDTTLNISIFDGTSSRGFLTLYIPTLAGYELTDLTYTSTTTTLDNVFEYSIDSIIKENNLGRINFMGWFTDLFLSDNAVNNRYVGYANWYMNYVMFISCAYLLFLVLMWFINFARRLLERGMNYDF